jgi:hypothetical protein
VGVRHVDDGIQGLGSVSRAWSGSERLGAGLPDGFRGPPVVGGGGVSLNLT